MGKINPGITQDFLDSLLTAAGRYRINVAIGEELIPIDVDPGVFPPKSIYSISSRSVYDAFGRLDGVAVADIGCGTLIEGIVAARAGAGHVDATDCSLRAVICSEHNAELNNLAGKINVYHGDLFAALPKGRRYDLIIANLPIVDYCPEKETDETRALYDPGLSLHKRLFAEALSWLAPDGMITFTHANLQSKDTEEPGADFDHLERMVSQYEYQIVACVESQAIGYSWRNYKIKPRN